MFIISKEWIHSHKSDRGGWNAIQFACIGIAWPPYQGWPEQVDGTGIPENLRLIFEDGGKIDGELLKGRRSKKKCKEIIKELAIWRGD